MDVLPQANDDTPIAVDFVVVKNAELLKQLLTLPASKWFAQREQMLRDYPDTLRVLGYELVPGQHLQVSEVPIAGEPEAGLLVYAGYGNPGMHRLRLDNLKKAALKFDSTDMSLVNE